LNREIEGLPESSVLGMFESKEALVVVDGEGSFIFLYDDRMDNGPNMAKYEGPKVPSEKAEALVAHVSKELNSGDIPRNFHFEGYF
jgi:hypothetical protein